MAERTRHVGRDGRLAKPAILKVRVRDSLNVDLGQGENICREFLVGWDHKVTPSDHTGRVVAGINLGMVEALQHGPGFPAAH